MTQRRRANTSVPIHPHLAARWSPRVFDAAAALNGADLTALLEAARWSATWGDRQPVRFVVGMRGDHTFEALAATLKRGNAYAKAASALILVCADQGPDEKTALYSAVDALTTTAFGRRVHWAMGRATQAGHCFASWLTCASY